MVLLSTPVELEELDDELVLLVVADTTCEVVGAIVVMMRCPESLRPGWRGRRSCRADGHSPDAAPAAGQRPHPAPAAWWRWTSLDRRSAPTAGAARTRARCRRSSTRPAAARARASGNRA